MNTTFNGLIASLTTHYDANGYTAVNFDNGKSARIYNPQDTHNHLFKFAESILLSGANASVTYDENTTIL